MTNLVVGNQQEALKYWSEVEHVKAECWRIFKGSQGGNQQIWRQLSPTVKVWIKITNGRMQCIIYASGGIAITWDADATIPQGLLTQDWVYFDDAEFIKVDATPDKYLPHLTAEHAYGRLDQRTPYWVGPSLACGYIGGRIYHGGIDYVNNAMPVYAAALRSSYDAYVLQTIHDNFLIEWVKLVAPTPDEGVTGYPATIGSLTGNGYVISADNGFPLGTHIFSKFSEDLSYCVVVASEVTAAEFPAVAKNLKFWHVEFKLNNNGDDYITPTLIYELPLPYRNEDQDGADWASMKADFTMSDVLSVLGHFELFDNQICFAAEKLTYTRTTDNSVVGSGTGQVTTAKEDFSCVRNIYLMKLSMSGILTETLVRSDTYTESFLWDETIAKAEYYDESLNLIQGRKNYHCKIIRALPHRKPVVMMADYHSDTILFCEFVEPRSEEMFTYNIPYGSGAPEPDPPSPNTIYTAPNTTFQLNIKLGDSTLYTDSFSYHCSQIASYNNVAIPAIGLYLPIRLSLWCEMYQGTLLDDDYFNNLGMLLLPLWGDNGLGSVPAGQSPRCYRYSMVHEGMFYGPGFTLAKLKDITVVRAQDYFVNGNYSASPAYRHYDIHNNLIPPAGITGFNTPVKTWAFKTAIDPDTNIYATTLLGEIDPANSVTPPKSCLTVCGQ